VWLLGFCLLVQKCLWESGTGLRVAFHAVSAMTELNSPSLSGNPQDYPWQAHVRGLVAHVVYGVVTDTMVRQFKKVLD